ncbi:hypothetical protein Pse7367_0386 [Thalassoporum mexicanum PCC 7367]|uniref:hypothetical protein n=1 Tax=Thalassoporum mexicanum TaxID=3457544 RepID=UPI00029FD56C|nr:hypothetical protein [Pseudanabaena sp. PCC 7367]AFY68697.1 hypothetical protein Pse7367_0386 [Pseudanabaena sp. PCC 7367]
MSFKFGVLVQRIKKIVPKARAKLQEQTAELESQLSKQDLAELSKKAITDLGQQLDKLDPPQPYREAIQTKLTEAIARWQEDVNAPNYLYVLARPIEPIDQILADALASWQDHFLDIKPLTWQTRPHRYEQIYTKLKEELAPLCQEKTTSLVCLPEADADRNTLIVLPNLSWCFLRCIDGLKGINYLNTTILGNRDRFWLIGCNSWTWHYFHHIYDWHNCFAQFLALPTLSDLELKTWLSPVSQELDLKYGNHNHQNSTSDTAQDWSEQQQDKWRSKSEKHYFEKLDDLALGSSAITAGLWLRSLRLKQEEPQEDKPEENSDSTPELSERSDPPQNKDAQSNNSEAAESIQIMVAKSATLPELPDLDKDDYYLLLSLGLHGGMNLADLALSLNESDSKVLTQMEALWQVGLIERDRDQFQLSPAFYPNLRRRLINNKILFSEAD